MPGRQLSSPGGAASIDEEGEEEEAVVAWRNTDNTVCVRTNIGHLSAGRARHVRRQPCPSPTGARCRYLVTERPRTSVPAA